MLDLNGSVKLGEDIYVYPNFISEEERIEILKHIESIPEDKWVGHFNEGGQGAEYAYQNINKLIPINKRIISMLDAGIYLGPSLIPTRMKKGWRGPLHSDNYEFLNALESNKNLKEEEEFEISSRYNLVQHDEDNISVTEEHIFDEKINKGIHSLKFNYNDQYVAAGIKK